MTRQLESWTTAGVTAVSLVVLCALETGALQSQHLTFCSPLLRLLVEQGLYS